MRDDVHIAITAADALAGTIRKQRRLIKRLKKGVKSTNAPIDVCGGETDATTTSEAQILESITKTVAMISKVEEPVTPFQTAAEAVKWVSTSILKAREEAILDTRKEKFQHSLNADQAKQAVELISKLSSVLS